jgi:hypothetical protein
MRTNEPQGSSAHISRQQNVAITSKNTQDMIGQVPLGLSYQWHSWQWLLLVQFAQQVASGTTWMCDQNTSNHI